LGWLSEFRTEIAEYAELIELYHFS
jgi:hypothetical protein